ncbi:PNK3P-domain-containing protein [Piromyces finnis]|uniref:PNK3P-domain-containing protein n=1 Tax=Piromyces finnis TaxID=1754191 RepID=A0A1Y1UPT9_9FUNG|nr:PNK3P-domain-containing protein [Piromyces finnis]|eukprot:ORX39476.1 PNK3P-domain-containing protein [Piromyces finnis]
MHDDWIEDDTILIKQFKDQTPNSKIAAFDLDDTIIKVKGKAKFPKDENDWQFLYSSTSSKLKKLVNDGYRVVIFSNQNGFSRKDRKKNGLLKEKQFKKKIENIFKIIDIPITIFCAVEKDKFRKPCFGMWNTFLEKYNKIEISMLYYEKSFFCGDAAGRPDGWKLKAKKDFSDTDRKFAMNCKLNFYTPDEYFMNEKPAQFNLVSDPSTLKNKDIPLFEPSDKPLIPKDKHTEMIIFVGYPGSGKSHFAKKYLLQEGYVHINQDTLKTADKCLKTAEKELKMQHSVVIDNTNPSKKKRSDYIKMAQKLDIPVRCFKFETPEDISLHNNKYREIIKGETLIPTIAYRFYNSNYVKPTLDEGFEEIKKINFIPTFDNKKQEEEYYNYYV